MTEIYTCPTVYSHRPSTLHIACTNHSEKSSVETAAAHGGVEVTWVAVGLSGFCLEGVLARFPKRVLGVAFSAILSEAVLSPNPRGVTTWDATNPTVEGSAAYFSNPNLSPKSQYRRDSSRFKPGARNSTNRIISLSYHDQPTTSTSNDLNADNPHPNSGSRRGVTSEYA